MRNLIRRAVNGTLGLWGYEFRRKHKDIQVLGAVGFATIIDGGANIGGYSVMMRSAAPNAMIHAFEPTPKLFQELSRRFAADDAITCYNQALGDKCSTAAFHLTPDTVSSSLLEETDEGLRQSREVVTVPVITLDAWADGRTIQRPALLKLDLEGNELAALRGAEKLLTQIDYVELETTFPKVRYGQPAFKEILIFMDDHGFDFIDIYPGILDIQTGRSMWADALFARRAPSVE